MTSREQMRWIVFMQLLVYGLHWWIFQLGDTWVRWLSLSSGHVALALTLRSWWRLRRNRMERLRRAAERLGHPELFQK